MKSIIFSSEMIRAIIAGRKTQTRRTVKNLEYLNFRQFDSYERWQLEYRFTKPIKGTLKGLVVSFANEAAAKSHFIADFCKYQVGDFLWVRESFYPDPPHTGEWDFYEFDDGTPHQMNIKAIPEKYRNPEHVIYKESWKGSPLSWKSPIYMPRWASRITLKITDIRIERIQETTEADAISEGCDADSNTLEARERWHNYCNPGNAIKGSHRSTFEKLWKKINGAESWNNNDWVFVYTFEVVEVRK